MNRREFDEAVSKRIDRIMDKSAGCFPWGFENKLREIIDAEENLDVMLVKIEAFLRSDRRWNADNAFADGAGKCVDGTKHSPASGRRPKTRGESC